MDSNEYYEKLESMLNDKSKFEVVNVNKKTHPIIAKERSIAYNIRKYFKGYDENLIRKLVPCGSAPEKIYGLVKVHKKDNPLRPVASMIGTPEYELAKFLDKIIKPFNPNNFMLESTNSFISELNQF